MAQSSSLPHSLSLPPTTASDKVADLREGQDSCSSADEPTEPSSSGCGQACSGGGCGRHQQEAPRFLPFVQAEPPPEDAELERLEELASEGSGASAQTAPVLASLHVLAPSGCALYRQLELRKRSLERSFPSQVLSLQPEAASDWGEVLESKLEELEIGSATGKELRSIAWGSDVSFLLYGQLTGRSERLTTLPGDSLSQSLLDAQLRQGSAQATPASSNAEPNSPVSRPSPTQLVLRFLEEESVWLGQQPEMAEVRRTLHNSKLLLCGFPEPSMQAWIQLLRALGLRPYWGQHLPGAKPPLASENPRLSLAALASAALSSGGAKKTQSWSHREVWELCQQVQPQLILLGQAGLASLSRQTGVPTLRLSSPLPPHTRSQCLSLARQLHRNLQLQSLLSRVARHQPPVYRTWSSSDSAHDLHFDGEASL